jgi:hypothetical protein
MILVSVWEDATRDVLADAPKVLSRGMGGVGITDRVAGVGTFSFTLDNSIGNSAATVGYYSPDHASVRPGFGIGTEVRLKIFEMQLYEDGAAIEDDDGAAIEDDDGNAILSDGGWCPFDEGEEKFYGKISDITPIPGLFEELTTSVQCVDFMNELLVHYVDKIDVQLGKTGNQLLGIIVANLPTPPPASFYATGPDVFAFSFHDIQDERTSAMNAVQRVDQSGLSFTFITGGGVLNWQSRNTRAALAPVAAFDNTMQDLVVGRRDENIYSTVRATGYPVYIGTTDEVLWTSRKEIVLPTGVYALVPSVRFNDPNGARRVALSPGTGIFPDAAAGDYAMSSVPGDGGGDLNGNFGRAVTWGGNTADLYIYNNSGVTGYVNILRLRGRIIRINDPIDIILTDTAANKKKYGDKTLSIAFPYLDNLDTLSVFAATVFNDAKIPKSAVDSLEFIANASVQRMTDAMACDVGRRITLTETVTGFSAKDFFVNSYGLTLERGKLTCKLGNLVPA